MRRKLLDEGQRARGVLIDDEIAEPEQCLLLDRAEQLQHRLHRHLALGRRGQLIECRNRVAVRAPRAPRDQRQRLVRRVDPFAVRDTAQVRHELREARALEHERLAA